MVSALRYQPGERFASLLRVFLFDKPGKEVIVIVYGESFITLSKGESMKRIDLKLAIYN